MKKLLYPLVFALSAFLFVYSCSTDEDDAPPPAAIVKKYTLAVTAGEGGTVSSSGGTYSQGTQVNITATPSSGFTFSQWSDGSTTNPITVTLNSNTNLSASFTAIINSYTLTVTAGEGGTVSTEGGTYDEGTDVTITATPAEGYEFVGWEGSDSTETSLTVTLGANTTLNALFEIRFGYYQFEPIPLNIDSTFFTTASLAADLDNDGNDELILTTQNPVNHANSNLIKKIPIKVLGFENEKLIDVTTKFFQEVPETYYTRQIFYEDLNHDGIKDLYFANHGAEVEDISKFYHQSSEKIDGIHCEHDLIFFNNGNIYEKANYFNSFDKTHGAGIVSIYANGNKSILRNETTPPPYQLGGKNSIITFENGEFNINNILSDIEYNLFQEYFCPASLWMYPIDIDSDGIDEIVSQSKIYKINENGYMVSNLIPGKYEANGYFMNEGGFVYDIDKDGDEDLVKSSSLINSNCQLINFTDHQIEFYENFNGELNPNSNKLPSHPTNLSKNPTPFDVNFDGLIDIVFIGNSPSEPNNFFLNTGYEFKLKQFNIDIFDGTVILNGSPTGIQQFPRLDQSYFLKNNEGYVFVTGISNGLIGFRITENNVNSFIK